MKYYYLKDIIKIPNSRVAIRALMRRLKMEIKYKVATTQDNRPKRLTLISKKQIDDLYNYYINQIIYSEILLESIKRLKEVSDEEI